MAGVQQLVDSFRTISAHLTKEQRAELGQIINQRIEQTMNYIQDVGKLIESAITGRYRQVWQSHLDDRRQEVNTLEELKRILEGVGT
jgi:hypothetical protein